VLAPHDTSTPVRLHDLSIEQLGGSGIQRGFGLGPLS
jgi:hypothetical protein